MEKVTKIVLWSLGALLVVAGIIVGIDPKFWQLKPLPNLSNNQPASQTSSTLPILGPNMPDFTGITQWYNTPQDAPLTPDQLKGKVVLVDFWTYSCINCIRTLPFLTSLFAKYATSGLVVVGVHTPEFSFEADPMNVANAVKQDGISYPVALDPQYSTWNAYGNHYWPAEYLFDAQGRLRHAKFGEGDYDQTEAAVRSLLAEAQAAALPQAGVTLPSTDFSDIATNETYFGLERGDAFMGTPGKKGQDVKLTASPNPNSNQWTAGGMWRFEPQYIETRLPNDIFRFNVQADRLHLVMSSADGQDKHIQVMIDGQATGDFVIHDPQLYTVAEFPDGGRHTVEIRIQESGLQIFSATFS